jgi:peptidoglycan biosynthesis protein MviN/MurJ (putative lipid II flippase)
MVLILLTAYLTGVVDMMAVSYLPEGSLSTVEFSMRLHDVVVRLSVVSLATAIFPILGLLAADGRHRDFLAQVGRAIGVSFLILLPLGLCVLEFAPWAISALFERGKFTEEDTRQVALIWGLMSLALLPTAGVHITARALQTWQCYGAALVIGVGLLCVHLTVALGGLAALGLGAIPLAHLISQSFAFGLSYLWLLRETDRRARTVMGSDTVPKAGTSSTVGTIPLAAWLLLAGMVLAIPALGMLLSESSVGWDRPGLTRTNRLINLGVVSLAAGGLLAVYGLGLLKIGIHGLDAVARKLGIGRSLY